MTDIIYPPGAAPVDGVTTTLATVVQLTAETTRATGAETTLTNGLAAEASTARAAELTNATAIASETSRATAAEGALLPLAGGTLTGALAGTSFAFTGAGTVGTLGVTPTLTLSGSSAIAPLISVATNISGSSTAANKLVSIFANSDSAALTGTVNGFPLLSVTRQFGGAATVGGRQAGFFGLVSNIAIPPGSPDQQYNTLLSFYDGLVNVGGTSLVAGSTRGSAVAFYPQTWLHAGATNYSSAVNFEADINVTPTIQQLTVGTTGIVAADVVTLTFTSGSIAGSPVAVTYTVGTGNVATHIVNGLMAAINANASLAAAGVCGMQNVNSSAVLDICWQTQTTVTVAVSSTGAESLTLGSVVGGASTRSRNGGSISRGNADGQAGFNIDYGFGVTSLAHSPISGAFAIGYLIGGGGVWPVAWNGTIFGATEQNIMNQGAVQGPFSPAKAKYGFDLFNVNFTQASGASLRMPGFQVDGTGVLSLKDATFTVDTSGLTIAVAGVVGSGNPAIVAGGGGGSGVLQGNYFVGDIVKDANGGQYLVAAVNTSTGAVTSLTTLVQPSAASAWGTGLATTGGSGTGLTITPTAAANTTINLANNVVATAGGGSISIQPNVTNGVIDAGAANLVIKSGTSGTGGLVNVFPTLQAPSLVLNKAAVTTGVVIGIKQGIALTGSSTTSPASVNLFSMSSDVVAAPNGLNVINIAHQFGGSGLTGSRNSLAVTSTFTAQSGNASGSGYGPAQFTMTANAADHGTATTAGNAHGNLFGFNTVAHFGASATNWAAICGYELDVYAESGSTVMDKIGEQIVLLNLDVVQGVRDDQALSFNNQYTQAAGTGWKTLIGVGRQGGFPGLDPTSGWILQCIPNLGVGSVAGAGGLDFTNFVPVTAFMQGNNFLLDPSGNFKANTFKVGSNQVVGARDTGWSAMTGSPDKASVYATGTVTLAQLAGRVAQLQASMTAHGLIGA